MPISLPFCPVYAINKGEETKNKHMDTLTSLLVVGFAALIHASFQLSVSVLTMLSSHTIGAKRSHAKLMRLTLSFIAGTKIMTLLLVSFLVLVLLDIFGTQIPQLVWACACGLLVGVGVAVWLFYYRREKGTSLWVPRSFARHLNERSKVTKTAAESFSLGLTGVISELLFIIGPVVITALVLIGLPSIWQLVGLVIYTVISTLSSLIVWGLIGSGHSLSRIQKWRENNKQFLRFAGGGGLLILGFFVYVNEVVFHIVGGGM
ncbi:MAG: rane protein of unknown function [Candidatus Saccharibacteria bacterium]|nr:rane protein of unknown function [Candidatus Saccharibacteria bacterium]